MRGIPNSPIDMVLWFTDCTLATVSYMAQLKRKNKSEFSRQIEIAQAGCDFLRMYDIDTSSTRAEQVKNFGWSVLEWQKQFNR